MELKTPPPEIPRDSTFHRQSQATRSVPKNPAPPPGPRTKARASAEAEKGKGAFSAKNSYILESGDESETVTESTEEMMERVADLLSFLDRELKFEAIKEAGLVQIHVIDRRDGSVVRKIPSDEIVELIEIVKERLSDPLDQMDIWA